MIGFSIQSACPSFLQVAPNAFSEARQPAITVKSDSINAGNLALDSCSLRIVEMPVSSVPPNSFHIMAKPTGALCNLNCSYCFFLSKEKLYPNSDFRMSDEVMESHIRQVLEAQSTPEVTIAWQGGEPTLMGIDFYRRVMTTVKQYQNAGTTLEHTIQTNGVLLDEEWCAFLRDNNFLVGISIDGPEHLHDVYRRDKGDQPTHARVIKALRLMQRMGVEFNILCTVNDVNSHHPLEVYRHFRDELGARFIQFIPIVERINNDGFVGFQEGDTVTDRSVHPEHYGRFLIEIWDEWVRRDVGDIFIQLFDASLASWVYGTSSLCIFRPTCGRSLALEHNGDLYSCDHFVEPKYFLGNILKTPIVHLVESDGQHRFGQDKFDSLPKYCLDCRHLFACNGECPKNRFIKTPTGEPGLNYLCAGLKAFFGHVDAHMHILAELVTSGHSAPDIMPIVAQQDSDEKRRFAGVGRNERCPCGSQMKFKHCHGS